MFFPLDPIPPGLKARISSWLIAGTTKVVPFQSAQSGKSIVHAIALEQLPVPIPLRSPVWRGGPTSVHRKSSKREVSRQELHKEMNECPND
jgi:hypothetical protein